MYNESQHYTLAYQGRANKLELQVATLNENIDGINSWAAIH
jgi:hypothetical protein